MNKNTVVKISLIFAALILLTLPLDQWTKNVSQQEFLVHEDPDDTTIYQGRRREVLAVNVGDVWATINMTYVRNHGASWGIFAGLSHEWRLPVLLISGLLLCGVLLFAAFKSLAGGQQTLGYGLTGLVAGGVGNFMDRVQFGYVVDFITFRGGIGGILWSLPSFNVADIVIVFSLIMILIGGLMLESPKTSKHKIQT